MGRAGPKRRTHQLVIRQLNDETLVYGLESHQATCLDAVATRIWQLCDGSRDLSEIGLALDELKSGSGVNLEILQTGPKAIAAGESDPISADQSTTEALVVATIDRLDAINLLDCNSSHDPGHISSRRFIVRSLAASAAALTMVATITAPTAAQIASCGGQKNDPCRTNADCCPGYHCNPSKKCKKD